MTQNNGGRGNGGTVIESPATPDVIVPAAPKQRAQRNAPKVPEVKPVVVEMFFDASAKNLNTLKYVSEEEDGTISVEVVKNLYIQKTGWVMESGDRRRPQSLTVIIQPNY